MAEKHILDYIRIGKIKQVFYPLALLAASALILFNLPLFEYFHITSVADNAPLSSLISGHRDYVRTTAHDLYYTGEDYYVNGALTGHYYYELSGSYCRFYILRPSAGKPAETYIKAKTITGRLTKLDSNAETMIRSFAETLEWSTDSLLAISDNYLINEVIYFPPAQLLLFVFAILFALLGFIGVCYALVLLAFPKLSTTYLRLRNYGDADKIIRDVDKEIADNMILKEGSMVLTPKYLVEYSAEQSAVIPLQSVLWVFETSRMKFILRERRERMFYSLRIVTITGDTFIIRDKRKKDIQAIEDVLIDRYPNFFYGYSDEHDKMVRYILEENEKELKAVKKKQREQAKKQK